jgi:hypothetical protein
MAVTLEDTLRHLKDEFQEALKAEGITPALMAKKLREELDATEIKVFFDKNAGKIVYGKKKLIAWNVRQKARLDVQRLLNLYPEEGDAGTSHPDMSGYLAALDGAANEAWGSGGAGDGKPDNEG